MTADPKKTVVLHIGTGKTATSFIQESLNENIALLHQNGLHYVQEGQGNSAAAHHKLHEALSNSKEWWMAKADTPDALIDRMVSEIEETDVPCSIISQEGLVWLPPEKIHFLALKLETFDVRIVLDVRRQDSYVDSALSETVKSAGRPYSFDQLWRYDGSWFVPNYHQQLTKWEATFGTRAIVVRPFERSQFLGQSVLSDFFIRAIGRDVSIPGSTSIQAQNMRMSRDSLEFKRLMNVLFLDAPHIAIQYLRNLEAVDAATGWNDYSVVSTEACQRIILETYRHNAKIFETFNYPLPDGSQGLKPNVFTEPFVPQIERRFEGLNDDKIDIILDHIWSRRTDLVRFIAKKAIGDHLDNYDVYKINQVKDKIQAKGYA